MKKINFQSIEVFTDITKSNKVTGDARESFANILYTQTNGIKMHALAMKIYQSDGATEYNDEELQVIDTAANRYCTPAFIDGLNEQLKSEQ